MARRHSFQDRRHAADPARQTPALELDVRPPLARRRLTAALPGGLRYIARAFFFRADLVGLAVEEDGESLLVREATAAEKDNAIRVSAYLTSRPTAAIARISGFAGEVPEPDPAAPPPLTRSQRPL